MSNFLKLLLLIVSCVSPLQSQPQIPFKIDQRLELVQLVVDLAAMPKNTNNRDISLYAPLEKHAAVRLIRSLPDQLRDSTILSWLILYYGDFPEFKSLASIPEYIRKWISPQDERELILNLKDFSRQALPLLVKESTRTQVHQNLTHVFNARAGNYYHHIDAMLGFAIVRDAFQAAFQELIPANGVCVCQLDPAMYPNTFLLFHYTNDHKEQQEMQEWVVPLVVEYNSKYALESIALPPLSEKPARKWLPLLQKVNKIDSPTWEIHVRRSLACALNIRVAEVLGEQNRFRYLMKDAMERLPWAPRLVSRWKELDAEAGKSVTLLTALPELLKIFDKEEPVVKTKTVMTGVKPKANA